MKVFMKAVTPNFSGFIGKTRLASFIATRNEWKRYATRSDLDEYRRCISARRMAPIFCLGALGHTLMYLAGPHGQLMVGGTADLLGTGGFGMVALGAVMLAKQGRIIMQIQERSQERKNHQMGPGTNLRRR
jgi:hypothetical protein